MKRFCGVSLLEPSEPFSTATLAEACAMSDISRRDFINGVGLTIASGLTPIDQIGAAAQMYPPALIGLRGHHVGSFEVAHALVREQKTFSLTALPVEEHYDLVVIGGGISGLAAAFFYGHQNGPSARILILENHDDFGGHAKRNEFRVGGRLILGYGGTESLQSPKGLYSKVARSLLKILRVDVTRFETAFDRELYSSLGLSRGIFFDRQAFGRDVLVIGDPTASVADDVRGKRLNMRPIRDLVANFPISAKSKHALISLYEQTQDPLPGKTSAEKISILKKISYRDYLIKYCGCKVEVVNCFQGRTLDFFALGCDSIPAFDLMEVGYPGFAGLKLPARKPNAEFDEPYIYHFPDGNASIARLLVRALVPDAAPGRSMEDVILAKFDYEMLDRTENRVRIRLNSTCVQVRNEGNKVDIGYVRDGKLFHVTAKHVVLACFNMFIPYIMPELSEGQREALGQNVKAPMLYNKVVIKDWNAWANLGVHNITAPMSFHSRVKLDYPVSFGDYRHSRHPAEPMCLHLSHIAGAPNEGLDARAQFRIGRQKILEMTFDQVESRIRDELDRMLGPGGFSSDRDIAAITVNRWSHGYSYTPNSLFDNEDYQATIARARQPVGHVAIANSDSEWSAYTHSAIDAAYRAVHEVLSS
jgi:spermidine dehydrogenase